MRTILFKRWWSNSYIDLLPLEWGLLIIILQHSSKSLKVTCSIVKKIIRRNLSEIRLVHKSEFPNIRNNSLNLPQIYIFEHNPRQQHFLDRHVFVWIVNCYVFFSLHHNWSACVSVYKGEFAAEFWLNSYKVKFLDHL